MKINRYLKESCIIPVLKTYPLFPGNPEPGPEELSRVQEGLIAEFAELFDREGFVANKKKLTDDLLARERRTSTAIGQGLAFPHVRTQQARRFAIAIGRSKPGLPFGALDKALVHVFIAMIAPPHDDKFFIQIEQSLAQAFTESSTLYDAIRNAANAGEIIRAFSEEI